jgi:glycosyltransferase involved in cell wall biosynthesis
MRVNFLLPGRGEKPGGGFKVVYEYANGLARRGHDVSLIHPARLEIDTPFSKRPEKIWRFLRRKIDGSYRPDGWFAVDEKVHLRWVPSLDAGYIPHAEITVATACATAEWLAGYPPEKGNPYYLIQGYETFSVPEDRLLATWRLPFQKIVVSKWLQNRAEEIGENALYIPNGIDFQVFGIDIDIQQRSPAAAAMMYHKAESKGWADGLAALDQVRMQVSDLRLLLFGLENPPGGLPGYITYFKNPSQGTLRRIYNEAAIFIAPSWFEGWGLPPAEAMACGCAVAATDNGGHREFARHEVTALLSPTKDPSALAGNILRLMQDEDLRLRIALAGNAYIKNFTWDKAVNAFEQAILGSDNRRTCFTPPSSA